MDIEKIKTHLKEHKEAYIAGSCGIVLAVFTGVIVRGNTRSEVWFSNRRWGRYGFPTEPKASVSSPFSNNINSLNTTTINNNYGCNSLSYILGLEGTDKTWLSQADFGRDFGITQPDISKYFLHNKPLPGGLEPFRIGVHAPV